MAMEYKLKEIKVSLIQSTFNGGYGYGNNIGIKYALNNDADYILILNNDTIVTIDFLKPMVKMCEQDTNIGIVGGKVYFCSRPDIIWYNGGKFFPCTAKVIHFNFNQHDIGQVPQEPITFISGCMWLIPKKVFKDVGFINEEYFMYVEDVEFCLRVIKERYILKICQDSHICHKVGSAGGGHLSKFSIYWMSRNKLKFIHENMKGLCYYTALLNHIFYISAWWLIHKERDLFISHTKGFLDYFKNKK